MTTVDELPITLPAAVVESTLALAEKEQCTPGELLGEALRRYQEVDQLQSAIASGQARSEAVEDFLEQYGVRLVHEYRAERRAMAGETGERKAP